MKDKNFKDEIETSIIVKFPLFRKFSINDKALKDEIETTPAAGYAKI